MDILKCVTNVTKLTKDKSPMLLVVAGLAGMAASMIMVNEVAPKAKDILEEKKDETKIEKIKAVTPLYLPAALTFTASAACIVGSYKINMNRIAGYATAYTITEHKLEEYQKKVIETIGEEKEKEIQKEIVNDHIRKQEEELTQIDNPDESSYLLDGKQWFWDDVSKRFFRASLQDIFDAREDINIRLQQYPVKLNEFYCELELEEVESLDIYEWAEGDKVELRFEPHVCKDGITTVTGIYYDIPISMDYSLRY